MMKVTPTRIPDVLLVEPKVFGDERGFFFERFNQKAEFRRQILIRPPIDPQSSFPHSDEPIFAIPG